MKVLIISYNPLTLYNNGGKYILSLFSTFSKQEMCQVYFKDVLPDKARCESYYRVTDNDVLKSFALKSKQHELSEEELEENVSKQIISYSMRADNYRYAKLLIRDLVWKIAPWKKDMYRWIEKERPDCIFSDTGDSCFIYDIAMNVSRKYNIPIIASFGDDYYGIKAEPKQFIKRVQLFLLRRKLHQFIPKCAKVITINDMFSEYYSDVFSIPLDKTVFSMANGSNYDFSDYDATTSENSIIKLGYLGNISLGRGDNLLEIGKALDCINAKEHTNHELLVYAKDYLDFAKKSKEIASIKYMGFVSGEKFISALLDVDILIHTESFSKENIEMTKLSLSTKIADSVNTGKCILAYGPKDIASMKHLENNNCAHMIYSPNQLENQLEILLTDASLRKSYIEKAKECAQKYHNSEKNSKRLKEMCVGILERE